MATTKEKEKSGDVRARTSLELLSDEINTILAEVLGQFLVQGNPTKHGGLRFLDVQSAKTFGFEPTQVVKDGNLVVISGPVEVKFDERDPANLKLTLDEKAKKIEDLKVKARERIENAIKKGPHSDTLHRVDVRASRDKGKSKKLFVEVQYLVPTAKLVSDANVLAYAQKHGMTNTSEAVRRILREHVVAMAKGAMDHLVGLLRKEK